MGLGNDLPSTVTVLSYGVGGVFGILFLIWFSRTDWFRHPWGRNVFVFMVLLSALELFGFSRRFFGEWPGQKWVIAGLSVTIAGVQGWRWLLQVSGNRRQNREKMRSREVSS